ncbi:MAG TPA: hypothetical protein VHL11_21230 [Phototrophicaceae bacterium]|nr:hypothetical protein [Phototrophicaceae bacterium]
MNHVARIGDGRIGEQPRLWLKISFSNSAYGRLLSYEGLYHLLKRIGKRAGITAPVNPHAFRHGFAH